MSDAEKAERASVRVERLVVPVTTLIAVLITALPVAWVLSGAKSDIQHEFKSINDRLERLELVIKNARPDPWSRSDERAMWRAFQRANPALSVPAVDEVVPPR